jgi:ABC-type transport system substrate-binding protein
LAFETRASAQRDLHVKTLLPVVDAWRAIGLDVETQVIPAARATDREEQSTFPGFQVLRQPAGRDRLLAYHSAEARVPERSYTGNNNGRYMSPDLDRLIDQLSVTMQPTERLTIAGQIVHHITDQLPVLPLFFDATPILIHNRLRGMSLLSGDEDARQGWNSYEWEVE